MKDAGYEYIVLDDAWLSKERDADGNLQGDPKRFPSGMKALGDYLHGKGFKFGIYNCAGTKTCAGYPGGYQHEEADAKMYASWGVDYLKYDWCNTEQWHAKERYTAMRDALHAAGRPIVFSMCEWGQSKPWTWAADVGHLWRTTGDIAPIWDGKPKKEWENPRNEAVCITTSVWKNMPAPATGTIPTCSKSATRASPTPSRVPTSRCGACSPRR